MKHQFTRRAAVLAAVRAQVFHGILASDSKDVSRHNWARYEDLELQPGIVWGGMPHALERALADGLDWRGWRLPLLSFALD